MVKMLRWRSVWTGLWMMIAVTGVKAQEITLPLIDDEILNYLHHEISGDAAYEHIRHNTQFHRQRGGADGLMEVAEYYEEKANEYGLEDVQLIKQDYWIPPWNAESAELWTAGGQPERIASHEQTPLHLADYSSAVDVEAELIYVGSGTSSEDYENVDVEGKVVLAHGSLTQVSHKAVYEHGAEGVVWYPDPTGLRGGITGAPFDYPDQIHWSSMPTSGPDGEDPRGFAFILNLRQGLELYHQKQNSDGPFMVSAEVDAGFDSEEGEEPWQVMVEGYIRGSNPDKGQDIILTGHMQEEKFSANDDASGTANILEIGRTMNKLIERGVLDRPERNIRFWWVTEFSSQRQYFADYPDAHEEMWVNINQDMVGADQSQDVMRVQNITRLPATRFHFFNDVVESVVDYMVASNNSELAQIQTGNLDLYPRPHLSRLGSKHRYNAKMIWFHANTDHIPFNEAPIGVPGITFTNFPDHYIHTSDDDLWNIDRTQLGRNALAGSMIAWIMATADEDMIPMIASEVQKRGAARMSHNLGLGLQWISDTEMDGERAFHKAVKQIQYARDREHLAAGSLEEVGEEGTRYAYQLSEQIDQRYELARAELEQRYLLVRDDEAPDPSPTEGEQDLEGMVPELSAGPEEFLDKRGQIGGVPDLHNLMAFEILNAVDGETSARDIYRLVTAQAREAGSHYYGTVEPEMVEQYLYRAADTGVVTY